MNFTPTVTQLGREGAKKTAPGELFVIQFSDGSFCVIDGGLNVREDADALMSFLYGHKPTECERPCVSWMFTHAHCDHMHLALAFLEENYNKIDLSHLCYSFPDFTQTTITYENPESIADCKRSAERIDELLANKYPKAQRVVFHTGDVIKFPECDVEILYTYEDFPSEEFPYVNHTSAAWKMNFSTGRSFLVPGDCEKSLCAQMAEKYAEGLKCDVFHTTHHGFNGGELDFYRLANPSVCFWTVDRERFENDTRCLGTKSENYPFNLWIRANCPHHYPADETVTVNMETLEITADK